MLFNANNSVTFATLRDDLRVRLGEISEKFFRDEELHHWLILGQYDTWQALKDITSLWYGERDNTTLTITDNVCDISSLGVSEVVKVLYTDDSGVTWHYVKPVEPKDFEGFVAMGTTGRLYDVASDVGGFYMQQGQSLYFTHIADAIATELDVYYVAKPTEPASDAAYVFCQEEFHDLVVLFAQTKAFQKLGAEVDAGQRAETEQQIAKRIEATRQVYMTEMQMEEYRRQMNVHGK